MLLIALVIEAQDSTVKGYRIESDEVVFLFNENDYDYLTHDLYQDRLETSEVYIKTVAVAGEFNNWSKDKWQMKKVSNSTYELRKKIKDFINDFGWEFKFVVNNHYWAEPDNSISNISPAKERDGSPLYVYNLRMRTAKISDKGNATFRLKGFKDAEQVILSGSFNKWNEHDFKMKPTPEGWELTLQLKPDIYMYKFIVDGQWMEDPNNLDKVENEYDGYNSVIRITGRATFYLDDFKDAKKVIVAGTFNDWCEDCDKMIKTKRGWKFDTQLLNGKHHYKFIVDGRWMTDPKNPVREHDGKGNINSVYIVRSN